MLRMGWCRETEARHKRRRGVGKASRGRGENFRKKAASRSSCRSVSRSRSVVRTRLKVGSSEGTLLFKLVCLPFFFFEGSGGEG